MLEFFEDEGFWQITNVFSLFCPIGSMACMFWSDYLSCLYKRLLMFQSCILSLRCLKLFMICYLVIKESSTCMLTPLKLIWFVSMGWVDWMMIREFCFGRCWWYATCLNILEGCVVWFMNRNNIFVCKLVLTSLFLCWISQ